MFNVLVNFYVLVYNNLKLNVFSVRRGVSEDVGGREGDADVLA